MRLKTTCTIFAAAVCFALIGLIAPQAQASSIEAAKAFAENVAQEAMDTIEQSRSKKISQNDARIRFRKILNERFDIPTIARFTLGRYWRVATDAEQKEFTHLLQTTILDKYADRMLEYSGDGFKIGEASAINDKDHAVTMTVLPKGKAPVDFAFRLRKNGKDSFKIVDIAVEGVSMSVTHRSDFASLIERKGGKVQALITALKNKEFSK